MNNPVCPANLKSLYETGSYHQAQEVCPVPKQSFVSTVCAYAKNAAGRLQDKVITPLTAAVKDAAMNPNSYIYSGSVIGGAATVYAAVKLASNAKSQGIKKQLPTIALFVAGTAAIGAGQFFVNPAQRLALGLTTLASGAVAGAYIGISKLVSSK